MANIGIGVIVEFTPIIEEDPTPEIKQHTGATTLE
jgi:hypothetical protein